MPETKTYHIAELRILLEDYTQEGAENFLNRLLREVEGVRDVTFDLEEVSFDEANVEFGLYGKEEED